MTDVDGLRSLLESEPEPEMTDEELARKLAREDAYAFEQSEMERKEMESRRSTSEGLDDSADYSLSSPVLAPGQSEEGFSPVESKHKAGKARAAARKSSREELLTAQEEICRVCAPCGNASCRAKCVLPCLGHFLGKCSVKGQPCTWSHCEDCLRIRKLNDWQARMGSLPPSRNWGSPKEWATNAVRANRVAMHRVIANDHPDALGVSPDGKPSNQWDQWNPPAQARESDPTVGGIFTRAGLNNLRLNSYEFGQGLNVQADREQIMTWAMLHPDARADVKRF